MIAGVYGICRSGVALTLPMCILEHMSNHNNSGANMTTKCNTPDELRKQMSYTERYSPLWMSLNGLLAEAVRNQPVTVTLTDEELLQINVALHNRMVTLSRAAGSDDEMDIVVSALGKIDAARRA